jgi:hypothetical protein
MVELYVRSHADTSSLVQQLLAAPQPIAGVAAAVRALLQLQSLPPLLWI